MANASFSPRDFRAWIIKEATPGTSPTLTSGMHQLDVDSVSMPSLNVNQVLDVRSRIGRIFDSADFFQDNKHRSVEVSLSGTFHNDAGHRQLLQSACSQTLSTSAADVNLAFSTTGNSGEYGVTQNDVTFSLVLASHDVTDGYNFVMDGCMVTNFSITADMATDGGMYKWSATISSGQVPALTNGDTMHADTKYTGSPIALSTLGTIKVANLTSPVLSSMGVTIDSPAVYTGTSSTGYKAFSRGPEIAVTCNAQVKYDALTRPLFNTFDGQTTSAITSNFFTMTQGTATDCSITIGCGVITNAALSEGDIMMVDFEGKAAVTGSLTNVIQFDLA